MSGPAPTRTRRRRNAPASGEWQNAPAVGWRHGATPKPPDGLLAPSRDAWTTWFGSWFAAYWTPADLPLVGLVIAKYDSVKRGKDAANDLTALVRMMDNLGITPAGQQARHWAPPKADEAPVVAPTTSRYAHLRSVG